jgi:hypothetical protein
VRGRGVDAHSADFDDHFHFSLLTSHFSLLTFRGFRVIPWPFIETE